MRKNRIFCVISAFCMVVALLSPARAAAPARSAYEAANALYTAGLMQGAGENADGTPNFALIDVPTRAEAVAMLVRLLGQEENARARDWNAPFSDVPSWAAPYVGYAYANGLVKGQSQTRFGSEEAANAGDFQTFLFRALGYSEAAGDFAWDSTQSLAQTLGLTFDETSSVGFTRGDMAKMACDALYVPMKGLEKTLLQALVDEGAIAPAAAQKAGLSDALAIRNDAADAALSSQKETLSSAPAGAPLSAAEIYEKCSPAVFCIELFDANHKLIGLASGFFISADGKAITNYHVIEDASYAKITLADGETSYDVAGVYDYSAEQDLALLKISGTEFPYLKQASSALAGGQTVYAIGNPLGLSNSITQGIISNISRVIEGTNYIQISAPISEGSSGGALLNEQGEVIGVTSAGYDGGQNLNFAVPQSEIQKLKQTNLRPLTEIVRGTTGVFTPSHTAVNLKIGESAVISFKQTFPTASTMNAETDQPGAVRLSWGDWTADGKTVTAKLTGLKKGTANLRFSLYGKTGIVLAQTTVRVNVMA